MPDQPGEPVAIMRVFSILRARLRVQRAPGIPSALLPSTVNIRAEPRGASRRGIAVVHLKNRRI